VQDWKRLKIDDFLPKFSYLFEILILFDYE